MSVKLDNTIDYDKQELQNSSYTLTKLVNLSGNTTQSVGAQSPTDITYEIPPNCVNLARGYLTAKVKVGAQDSTYYAWVHKVIPFSSVSLSTRGGAYLYQVMDRLSDFSRIQQGEATDDNLLHGDDEEPLCIAKQAGKALIGGKGSAGSVGAPYFEQQYLQVGGLNADYTFDIKIPLKHLGGIFAVNKSILYREPLVLRIQLCKGADFVYRGTSNTNPDTGADDMFSTSTIEFSDLGLYIPVERNSAIVQSLNMATSSESGFSILFPYYSVYNNVRSGSSQATTIRANSNQGQSIRSIKTCIFSTKDNHARRYDRWIREGGNPVNTQGNKCNTYRTLLNGQRLQEYDIDASKGQDWVENKDNLKNGIYWNKNVYQLNWSHTDNFSNQADTESDMKTRDTQVFAGISTRGGEVRHDFYLECDNQSNRIVSVVEGIKTLSINAKGLLVN